MMTKFRFIIATFIFCSALALNITAQDIPSDLGKVKVEELTDTQIESMVKRAEESGMTQQQLEAAAMSRGMSASQIQKLRERIEQLQTAQSSQVAEGSRLREKTELSKRQERLFDDIMPFEEDTLIKEKKKPIFGRTLFQTELLTFEPSLNIPTPKYYVLGPGDELVIDIWGASQANYQQEISPDGYIFIDNLGPVYVSGYTIEKASAVLKNRLTSIYSGLSGDNPNTFVQTSLGKIRSIKVSVVGEATVPGSYTLPSLSTVFNALYLAGGPNEKGTLRNIQIIRDGEKFAEVDVYDFLINGNGQVNKQLKDNDIIMILPYENRVETEGEVKREAIYELKPYETVKDLILFAGGFTETAFRERVKIERNTGSQKAFFDVSTDQFTAFQLQNGDILEVEKVLNRFENRVKVEGAVFRPGYYQLTEGMTVMDLINKANGLREDAYLAYASLFRLNEQNKLSVVPVSVIDIKTGLDADIVLQREDMLKIPSVFDLEERFTVSIEGEVQEPGKYTYHENLTIQEVIVDAGGLKQSSSFSRIEVARRVVDKKAMAPKSEIAEVFSFSVDENLKLQNSDTSFTLMPYDVVFIRKSPGYEEQKYVILEGEVAFPGKYALQNKDERISDIIERAGGFTDEAYIPGSRLVRKTEVDEERLRALEAIQQQSVEDTLDTKLITKEKDQPIGINMEKIVNNPGSKYDLILQEGDEITIPKEWQTVKASGALLYPVNIRYENGRSARYYINRSGGFAQNAKKSKVYVIYANGSVKRTHQFLFYNFYPSIEPGAEVVVPEKPERKGMSTQESISLATAVSTLGLVMLRIVDSF